MKVRTRLYNKIVELFFTGKLKKPVIWLDASLVELQVKNMMRYRFYNLLKISFRTYGNVKDLDNFSTRVIEEIPYFLSIKNHYLNQKSWEETQAYQNFNLMRNHVGHDLDLEKIREKKFIERWDAVYHSVLKHGFLSYKDIHKHFMWNVEVMIDQMGKVVLIDGRHRLYLAKILKIKNIEVVINHIDSRFFKQMNFKNIEDIETYYALQSNQS